MLTKLIRSSRENGAGFNSAINAAGRHLKILVRQRPRSDGESKC
jgi:hypothetical protein